MTTTKAKKTTTRKPRAKVVPIPNLPKNPFAFEVFDLVSRQKSKAKKIEALRKYGEAYIKMLLIWNFDESVISALPAGAVPYDGFDDQNVYSGTLSTKIAEDVRSMHENGSFSLGVSDQQGQTTLRRESKNFYRFIRGGQDSLKPIRRETMFINILEGIHPLEAEILILVKDKELQNSYNISREVVEEAFPDIVWGNRS
tara:strand:+ start:773 stop:1369 length:597 start_codon:yes stop_codon:yes gene_type:complete